MPEYYYQNEKTGEVKAVFQSMSEKHEYEDGGVKWQRVWQNPQLNTKGSKVDPFDKKKFVDKTGKMKGTYGDMLDMSKELSEERKSKIGYDPEQKKFFGEFEKKNGYRHHKDKPDKVENDFVSFSDIGDD
jgi:predicted nucleic acid-binding Zn ribbon protein